MTAFPSLNDRKKARRLVVVLGDQLDRNAAPIVEIDKDRDVVLMMEVEEESTHVPSHKQRTALFLSAMRHFAVELAESGARVDYVTLDDPRNSHAFTTEIERAVRTHKPESIHCTHPGEWRVLGMVESWRDRFGVPVEVHEDGHFFTTLDAFGSWASGRKSLTLEYFYRDQRKKHGVLMQPDGKTPVGDVWNFDKDNREAFKRTPRPPEPYAPRPDEITNEVLDLVESRLPKNPGELGSFRWPVTPDEARRALDDFIEHRLARFGPYEDAMWTEQPFLYHSLLSSSGNLKLLDPREAVRRAVGAYEAGAAPLNSVEGFVRQWLGWREFIRGVYWTQGPGYPNRNGLGHRGRLPELYWTADTDMACMRDCVSQVLEHGYAHHIPRLMVMGNLALIARVDPREVGDWYLGMFVDAVDWASCPNTIGMSQHADHGVVGTKPYAASGKYIARMSNYCEHCRYDVKQRTGVDACPFNSLYWDFLIHHEDRFKPNNRMAMILKNVKRMNEFQRVELTSSAKNARERLGVIG
ncbi:MAG: cryptochrome/photolyase family protein [Planctomycetota bacterium]